MTMHIHHDGCGCLPRLSRRGLLGAGFAGAMMTAFPALAAGGSYEAMLVNCIDPRFTTDTWKYMTSRGWQNKYSQFNIAGGPIGIVEEDPEENPARESVDVHVVHNWCLLGTAHSQAEVAELLEGEPRPRFDLDHYKILSRHLTRGRPRVVELGAAHALQH